MEKLTMHDVLDIIKNIENIYDSNTSFGILKDFERVLDQLDIYVYKNWEDGELADGPRIERHWVTCAFMWDADKMPDPSGGKRLLDYDCKVSYKKSHMIKPRTIRKPGDVRPGSKKGKLDRHPIWIVEIQMPISLITDIYSGYVENVVQPAQEANVPSETQPADAVAAPDMEAPVV
jgi:hypothetical protein|tara:strand:- start:767 stop:1294 length:528 start_codon:yes stop_codon:yes gene_type:complete